MLSNLQDFCTRFGLSRFNLLDRLAPDRKLAPDSRSRIHALHRPPVRLKPKRAVSPKLAQGGKVGVWLSFGARCLKAVQSATVDHENMAGDIARRR
jgi:hypothetical protein